MTALAPRRRKPRPPLDQGQLEQLALFYVGRFATSRARLEAYLARKVKERGWGGERPADTGAVADKLAGLGYVDDALFAGARARSLEARGYGPRRLSQALRQAGIDEAIEADTLEAARPGEVTAALRFAERKRIGPYAAERPDPKLRERWLAALLRAGHRFALARAIAELAPGAAPDREALAELR